eukprot:Nk52_evm14s1705 gene=Nk52_evmTU14s1705
MIPDCVLQRVVEIQEYVTGVCLLGGAGAREERAEKLHSLAGLNVIGELLLLLFYEWEDAGDYSLPGHVLQGLGLEGSGQKKAGQRRASWLHAKGQTGLGIGVIVMHIARNIRMEENNIAEEKKRKGGVPLKERDVDPSINECLEVLKDVEQRLLKLCTQAVDNGNCEGDCLNLGVCLFCAFALLRSALTCNKSFNLVSEEKNETNCPSLVCLIRGILNNETHTKACQLGMSCLVPVIYFYYKEYFKLCPTSERSCEDKLCELFGELGFKVLQLDWECMYRHCSSKEKHLKVIENESRDFCLLLCRAITGVSWEWVERLCVWCNKNAADRVCEALRCRNQIDFGMLAKDMDLKCSFQLINHFLKLSFLYCRLQHFEGVHEEGTVPVHFPEVNYAQLHCYIQSLLLDEKEGFIHMLLNFIGAKSESSNVCQGGALSEEECPLSCELNLVKLDGFTQHRSTSTLEDLLPFLTLFAHLICDSMGFPKGQTEQGIYLLYETCAGCIAGTKSTMVDTLESLLRPKDEMFEYLEFSDWYESMYSNWIIQFLILHEFPCAVEICFEEQIVHLFERSFLGNNSECSCDVATLHTSPSSTIQMYDFDTAQIDYTREHVTLVVKTLCNRNRLPVASAALLMNEINSIDLVQHSHEVHKRQFCTPCTEGQVFAFPKVYGCGKNGNGEPYLVTRDYGISSMKWRSSVAEGSGRETVIAMVHIFFEVLTCVSFLHSKKCRLSHLDIKGDNVLIMFESDNSVPSVVLCDFGSSVVFSEQTDLDTLMDWCERGTECCRSPEQLNYRCTGGLSSIIEEKSISEMELLCSIIPKADIWALGCFLYELFSGETMYLGIWEENFGEFFTRLSLKKIDDWAVYDREGSKDLLQKNLYFICKDCDMSETISDTIISLLDFLLVRSPLERPNAESVLSRYKDCFQEYF